jgi:hypothetical protein
MIRLPAPCSSSILTRLFPNPLVLIALWAISAETNPAADWKSTPAKPKVDPKIAKEI